MDTTCASTCAWPETRKSGRPSRFCHRRCQEKFERARGRLIEELREISEVLERGVSDRQVRLYFENQVVGAAGCSSAIRSHSQSNCSDGK